MKGTPEANCAEIWRLVKAEYRARKTPARFTDLNTTMFSVGPNGCAKLTGSADAIKHLGVILSDVYEGLYDSRCSDGGLQYGILMALRSSARLEAILDVANDFCQLPPGIADTFRDLCVRHVQEQQELNVLAGRRILNVTFTLHLLIHAGQRAKYQNPRLRFASRGRDLLLRVSKLMRMTSFGSPKNEDVHKRLLARMNRTLDASFP